MHKKIILIVAIIIVLATSVALVFSQKSQPAPFGQLAQSTEATQPAASSQSADATQSIQLPPEATQFSILPRPPSSPSPLALGQSTKQQYIKMLFLGDIMLGRYVRTLMEKSGNLNYPFERARTTTGPGANFFTGSFDRVIANLEGPILQTANRSQTGMIFGFAPDTAKILKQNGIDIVSIANNHTLDQGQKGLASTKQFLQEAALDFFGHPILPTQEDVLIQTIKGRKFAFVGLHDATRRLDEKAASELIATIDPTVDTTIIFLHWGIEYQKKNSLRQQKLAHAFIDAGADLIIGHHPHVVQNREIYKGVPIVYSLGNFIFDQYWSSETQKGMAIEVVFSTKPQDHTIRIFEHPYDIIRSQPSWR